MNCSRVSLSRDLCSWIFRVQNGKELNLLRYLKQTKYLVLCLTLSYRSFPTSSLNRELLMSTRRSYKMLSQLNLSISSKKVGLKSNSSTKMRFTNNHTLKDKSLGSNLQFLILTDAQRQPIQWLLQLPLKRHAYKKLWIHSQNFNKLFGRHIFSNSTKCF